MEKNIMTIGELSTRVQNFMEEIEPTIKTINEDVKNSDGTIGAGIVLAMAIPDGEGKHRFVGGILGRRDGTFEALKSLDNETSIIREWRKFEKARELHSMVSTLEDFRDFLKGKIEAEEQKQSDTDNE